MNLIDDNPITCPKDDRFNISQYAQRIAELLLDSFNENGSFAFGVNGEWGSGKTSFLNLVEYYLENRKDVTENSIDKLEIVHFNPWLCSSVEDIIPQFFNQLSASMKGKAMENIKKGVRVLGNVFKGTSFVLSALGNIAQLSGTQIGGDILKGIAGKLTPTDCDASKTLAENISTMLNHISESNEIDLRKQKDDISKNIVASGKQFIVFIDDIDRLSDKECIAVFQLVKIIADFSNTVYVLAFDKQVVSTALKSCQQFDGEKYLEKIIQASYDVPRIIPIKLYYYLSEMFTELYSKDDTEKQHVFKEIFNRLWMEILKNDITTMRDAVRFYNTTKMTWFVKKDELYLPDLIVIVFLKMFHNDWYKNIFIYRDDLIGNNINSLLADNHSVDTFGNIIPHDLSQSCKDIFSNCLYFLFPRFRRTSPCYNPFSILIDDETNKLDRMEKKNAFYRYFDFPVSDSSILTCKLNAMLLKADIDVISKEISRYHDLAEVNDDSSIEENYIMALQETFGLICKQHSESLDDIAKSIIISILNESCYIWPIHVLWRRKESFEYEMLLKQALQSLSYDNFSNILKDIFSNHGLDLSDLAHLFEGYEKSVDDILKFVDKKERDILFDDFISLTSKKIAAGDIFAEASVDSVLYYCTIFNNERIKDEISKFVTDDSENLLMMPDKVILVTSSSKEYNSETYSINLSLFDRLFDRDAIRLRLQEIIDSGKQISVERKYYIITMLHFMNDDLDMIDVGYEDIKKYI